MEECLGHCEKCGMIITPSMNWVQEKREDRFGMFYFIKWHEKCAPKVQAGEGSKT